MDLSIQDWGAIGEMAGALLVGATLIFFAIQLRQTMRSVETSALMGWLSARIAINESFAEMGKATINGMQDPKTLGDNAVRFGLAHQTYMMQGQITHLLFKRGLIPRDLWETEMGITAALLTSPGSRQWWDIAGKGQVTPEFSALMESTPPGQVFGWTEEDGFTSLENSVGSVSSSEPD